jgi:MFS family permease
MPVAPCPFGSETYRFGHRSPARVFAVIAALLIGFAGWTVWSANAGRRAARWGRRKLRRVALAVLLVGTALVLLTA